MMGYFSGFGLGMLGTILMLLFWVALILLAIWTVRALFPHERRNDHDVAVEVLKRRYAAGEITEAEYQQALKTLG